MIVSTYDKWTPHDRTDLDDSPSAPPWRSPEGADLAECERPGASIAAVAMAHGGNANLVHKWRAWAAKRQDTAVTARDVSFVPVPLQAVSLVEHYMCFCHYWTRAIRDQLSLPKVGEALLILDRTIKRTLAVRQNR
jgi:hypothetical protein